MQKKRLFYILGITAFILLIPLIAMQFSEEVNWNLFDFIVAGVLLLGTGIIAEIIFQKIKQRKYQIPIIAGLIVLLILTWAELGVGIFGTPFAGT